MGGRGALCQVKECFKQSRCFSTGPARRSSRTYLQDSYREWTNLKRGVVVFPRYTAASMRQAVPDADSAPRVALQIQCAALPTNHGAVNPICVLFLDQPGSALIGTTEWQQAVIAPSFRTVLMLPPSSSQSPMQMDSQLRLQIRHVDDEFWDAQAIDAKPALLAMPLLGDCTFRLQEALSAASSGLALQLMLTAIGTEPFRAAVRVTRPAVGEPWAQPAALALPHSCIHYAFPGAPMGAVAAPAAAADPQAVDPPSCSAGMAPSRGSPSCSSSPAPTSLIHALAAPAPPPSRDLRPLPPPPPPPRPRLCLIGSRRRPREYG